MNERDEVIEQCARVCEEISYSRAYHLDPSGAWCGGANAATRNCAAAIRSLKSPQDAVPHSSTALSLKRPDTEGLVAYLNELADGASEVSPGYGSGYVINEEDAPKLREAAALLSVRGEENRAIYYERRPELDKRIGNGDDYAGDAFVRWVAPGQQPDDMALRVARGREGKP